MHQTAMRPAIRAALTGFIDYAGLFPPAQLQLGEALERYGVARAGPAAWMLGRFIVPMAQASQAGALYAAAHGAPLELAVVSGASSDARQWFAAIGDSLEAIAAMRDNREITLGAVEVRLPSLASARETFDAPVGQLGALLDRTGLSDVAAYAEFPSRAPGDDDLPAAMRALRRAGLSAKLRCGGPLPHDVPPIERVAAFIAAATAENVAFKATAGLHHPVRRFDAQLGAKTHGFLNLLAAATFAIEWPVETLHRILQEEDAGAFSFGDQTFSWRDLHAGIEQVRTARRRFVGYGSCSFDEPVEDLTALEMLPPSAAGTGSPSSS